MLISSLLLILVPYRKTIFVQDQAYHTFNRGVARSPIFFSTQHYARFLQLVDYYRFANTPTSFSQLMKIPVETRQQIINGLRKENNLQVEILAFCLMPNHFHFLLKQIAEKGIINFMGNLQNSYVKYLNIREERVGPLFQSAFKAKRIETDEQLIHVSRYIHLNPSTDYLIEIEKLTEYLWSSLPSYLDSTSVYNSLIKSDIIINFFKNKNAYKEFIFDRAHYQRELAKIKHLILE